MQTELKDVLPVSEDQVTMITMSNFPQFFETLLSSKRKAFAVASLQEGCSTPSFDLGYLATELGDSIELFAIDSAASYTLTNALHSKEYSVHSGWLRVYPADPSWQTNPRFAQKFSPDARHPKAALDRIVNCVLTTLYRDSDNAYVTLPHQAVSARTACEAVVTAVTFATQAFVESCDTRRSAVINTSTLIPGVKAEHLLQRGQRISGYLQESSVLGTFEPIPINTEEIRKHANDQIGDGITTLARVQTVAQSLAHLTLVPGFDLEFEAERGEDLTRLLVVDDVVTIEIIRVDGQYVTSLSEDDSARALAILPGGPPWLEPDIAARLPEMDSSTSSIEAEEANQLHAEIQRLTDQVLRLEREKRELQRKSMTKARQGLSNVYSDPADQFRFEVELEWLSSVNEADRKSSYNLASYQIGEGFLKTVEDLCRSGGVTRDQILKAVMEVVCGLAKNKGVRAVKPWRITRRGLQERRQDRATAWRANIQSGTPSARRLKYWRLSDDTIELDSVSVHDERLRD